MLFSGVAGCFPATETGTQTSGSENSAASTKVENIYWSDGDSGRFDGVNFRLADVDAPETGGVGAAIGGADCEAERTLGFAAKAFMVDVTRNADITVRFRDEPATFERLIVDFTVDGVDLAERAIDAGHVKAWPHKNGRALIKKPEWCAD
ncbi:MAG: hypothetical protein AAFO63_08610 [Pseudomonadota bacterium]